MMTTLLMAARMMTHARGSHIGRNRQMHMALRTRRWTRADLDRMPEDGNRYEVVGGELLVTPAPRPAHAAIVEELGRILDDWCRAAGIGAAWRASPAVVTVESEVQPDIVLRARMTPPPDRWDDAPLPMLVVEVLSPSSRRHDLVTKRAFYMECGVPEYWIVDGEARSIRVVTPAGERIATSVLRWHPAGAPAPMDLDVDRLFDSALGPRQAAR
jgi:Uma2 family endonuclease